MARSFILPHDDVRLDGLKFVLLLKWPRFPLETVRHDRPAQNARVRIPGALLCLTLEPATASA